MVHAYSNHGAARPIYTGEIYKYIARSLFCLFPFIEEKSSSTFNNAVMADILYVQTLLRGQYEYVRRMRGPELIPCPMSRVYFFNGAHSYDTDYTINMWDEK